MSVRGNDRPACMRMRVRAKGGQPQEFLNSSCTCTRLILVQNCTQFRSRLPSRGPPCSRCPEAARVKDRPRCAIHSPKLNGEPCATLAQPWLPVWWHNSAEILQNSCRTSLRLHIRA